MICTNILFNNPDNANLYLLNFVFTGVMLLLGYGIKKSKRGWFVSTVVTPMTMSSEERWKKVNKVRATAIFITFAPLFTLNTILFLLKFSGRYAQYIFVLAIIGLFAEELFTLVYTDILERKWLKEQKEKGKPVSDLVFLQTIPKKTIIIGIVTLVVIFVIFVILSSRF